MNPESSLQNKTKQYILSSSNFEGVLCGSYKRPDGEDGVNPPLISSLRVFRVHVPIIDGTLDYGVSTIRALKLPVSVPKSRGRRNTTTLTRTAVRVFFSKHYREKL